MTESLPDGWEWRTVGDLAAVDGGLTKHAGKRARSKDSIPLVSVAAVHLREIRHDAIGAIGLLDSDGEKATLRKGDLLVVEGNGSLSHIGRVALWDGSVPNARHQNHLIRVRPHDVDSRYVLEWLASPRGREAIIAEATSAAGLYNLSLSKVARLPIPLAPKDQQRRIVEKIEALTAKSRRAKESLDAIPPLLERFRQSVLAAAFRGDLTKDWRAQHPDVEPADQLLTRIRQEGRHRWEQAELKELQAQGKKPKSDDWRKKYVEPDPVDADGLPELPAGWCWATIGELVNVGTGATPKRGTDRYWSGGTIPWVSSAAVNSGTVSEAREFVTPAALAETNLTLYPAGSLVLAMYGEGKTRGKCAELAIEATTNQALAVLCAEGKALKVLPLIRRFLDFNYEKTRALAAGGAQPNLNLSTVREIAVPVPPVAEQKVLLDAVGAALQICDRLEGALKLSWHSYQSLDPAILAKAFRGELVEPTDDSRAEPAP